MCFEIGYCLTFVFKLSQQALLLQGVLGDRLLLGELRGVEAFVRGAQFLDLVPDEVYLVLLLRNLVFFIFDIGLEVAPLVLQLAREVENLSLQGADLLGLRQDLLLHFSTALVGPERVVFELCFISCLHLRLLDEHLLLDLVHLLLLFDFHLIDDPAILLPQLLNIMHQLLIRFLSLVVSLFKVC